VGRQERRGARKLAWDYTTSTLLSASIHPTLENFEILRASSFGDSRKFSQFSSNSHLHPLHCTLEPIKHKDVMKCTQTL
jgi:hypothetical protein